MITDDSDSDFNLIGIDMLAKMIAWDSDSMPQGTIALVINTCIRKFKVDHKALYPFFYACITAYGSTIAS